MIRRRFQAALLAVALLSIACASAAQGTWQLGVGLMGTASLGWYLTRGGWGIPRWAMGVVLAGLVGYSLYQVLEEPGSRVAPFTTFLGSIVALKMWERRRVRDEAQLLSIALFLNIGAVLSCAERKVAVVWVGVLLVALVPALAYAVMLLQACVALERAGARDEGDHARGMRSIGWAAGVTALLAVVLATGAFVLIPRPDSGGGWGGFRRSVMVTAFRNTIELGRAGFLSKSQAVALTARLGRTSTPAKIVGPRQEVYFRGAVLDRYERGTWRGSMRERGEVVDLPPEISLRLSPRTTTPTTLRVVDHLAFGGERPLFAPWRPQRVHPQPGFTRLMRDPATDAMVFEQPEGALTYDVWVVRGGREGESAGAGGTRGEVAFPFPEAVREEAWRVLREAGVEPDPGKRDRSEDGRAARALEQHLRGTFTYTTAISAAPPGKDPTAWFLLEEKRGHCEYFASGLAALLRGVGIDARVVAGYVGSEYEEATRTFTVRQAGAHAWVEAEVGEREWRTLDATPPEELGRLLGEDSGVWEVVDRFLIGLESAWLSSVVNFDEGVRRSIVDPGGSRGGSRWVGFEGSRDRVREVVARSRGWWPWVVGMAAVAGVGWMAWRMGRRGAGPRGHEGELGRVYEGVFEVLGRAGHGKPAWRGGMEHLEEVPERARELARPIVELCYGSWFGGRRVTASEVAGARTRLAELRGWMRGGRR